MKAQTQIIVTADVYVKGLRHSNMHIIGYYGNIRVTLVHKGLEMPFIIPKDIHNVRLVYYQEKLMLAHDIKRTPSGQGAVRAWETTNGTEMREITVGEGILPK